VGREEENLGSSGKEPSAEKSAGVGEEKTGIVAARHSRQCEVWADGDEARFRCALRGKLWDEAGSLPLVGDRVRFRVTGPGQGAIEEIFPRRTVLSRRVGEGKRIREHRYCANVDTVVIVVAAQAPPLRPALIDRLLVTAQSESIDPIICLNKIDLDQDGEASWTLGLYKELGYRVVETSALTGRGVNVLADLLRGRLSVFSGHSGVGKTSLLKALIPGFDRRTRAVSKRARGRHATTEVYLVRLPNGGLVVDTPGFREFTVWGVEVHQIGRYYPEFLPFIGSCKFNNCLHLEEPGCAVREAVEQGRIHPLRYRNYLRLVETHGGV